MKKLTLSADGQLIKRARQVARSQGKTLNEAIREWLVQFTHQVGRAEEYDVLMKKLRRHVRTSGPYTRDEMNER
jgi:hypothetical protein